MKNLRYLFMAALVALPLTACDEDTDTVAPDPVVTGTVTGSVTAEGTALEGVGVTLAGQVPQSTTTDAAGSYTFSNVEAGSYGVAITVPPDADVVFSQLAVVTSITTQDEVQTVNFAGSYIRTASISGTVLAGISPLVGVEVNIIGGPDDIDITKTTGLGGDFVASGLRAGSYSVILVDPPATVQFGNLVRNLSVSSGETGTAFFVGDPVFDGSITGAVTVDNVPQVGVAVVLEGLASIDNTAVDKATQTGASGAYAFTGLGPGSYSVTIVPPEGSTFLELTQSADLESGEAVVLSFAGVGAAEPATISISSVTQGGVPVVGSIMGQIEVAINVERNGQTPHHVDVLIGDVVVATQQFQIPFGGPEAAAPSDPITVLVPTDQLMMGTDDLWTSTVKNGGNELSANLYVTEAPGEPNSTNKVPVVIENVDVLLPGNDIGGDLMLSPNDAVSIQMVGATPWYSGSATFSGPLFVSYTTETPTSVEFDADCAVTGETITGDHLTGIAVTNTYNCAGFEGNIWPDHDDYTVVYATGVGPDGTAVNVQDEPMAAIGAEFYLGDGSIGPRRLVITHPQDGQIEPAPGEHLDNKAPTVEVHGEIGSTVEAEKVAFNDDYAQWWVKGDYDFVANDVVSWDGGVGGVIEMAYLWAGPDADDCGAVRVTTPDADAVDDMGTFMEETVTSDGAPTANLGYAICGYAEDALGNSAYSNTSNSFGVDRTMPQARIWGDDASDAPPAPAPIGDAKSLTTPISPAMNTTIFGTVFMVDPDPAAFLYPGTRDATMAWGLDAIDDRAGLDDLAGHPFVQIITHDGVTPTACAAEVTDMAAAPLTDTWRRVAGPTDFLCGIAVPGIFTYEGYVVDRAGNESTHFNYNWLVDEQFGPMINQVVASGAPYTPGTPGLFGVYGTDDLEIMMGQLTSTYPTSLGDIDLVNMASPVGGTDRWDDVFTNIVSPEVMTLNPIFGRIDFTDGVGVLPADYYAGVADSDGNGTVEDADFLPTTVTASLSEDAGYNPPEVGFETATVTLIPFVFGGWTATTAPPWDAADLIDWVITDDAVAGEYIATHRASTSIDEPYFDQVLLVLNDAGTLTVCDATTTYVETDNGINRFYTYTFTDPASGGVCETPPALAAFHAVGVKGDALLATGMSVVH